MPRPDTLKAVCLILAFLGVAHALPPSLYDLAAVDIDGNLVSLSKYRGTVSLVVNVASFCGLTKTNYQELASLQRQLGGTGKFQVLAFPCNQFNTQEPKSNAEIKQFAEQGYGTTFPMFAKTTVNSPMCEGVGDACAAQSSECCPTNRIIYDFIKRSFPNPIQWNFEKILVDDQGIPIKRYPPTHTPLAILADIKSALGKINASSAQEPEKEDPRLDNL